MYKNIMKVLDKKQIQEFKEKKNNMNIQKLNVTLDEYLISIYNDDKNVEFNNYINQLFNYF